MNEESLPSIHPSAEALLLMPQPRKRPPGASDKHCYFEQAFDLLSLVSLPNPQSPSTFCYLTLHPIKPIRIFPRHAAAGCPTLRWGVGGAPGLHGDWLSDRLLADHSSTVSQAACCGLASNALCRQELRGVDSNMIAHILRLPFTKKRSLHVQAGRLAVGRPNDFTC